MDEPSPMNLANRRELDFVCLQILHNLREPVQHAGWQILIYEPFTIRAP